LNVLLDDEEEASKEAKADLKKLEEGLESVRVLHQKGKVFEIYKSGMSCSAAVKAALLVLDPKFTSCQEWYSF